MNALELLKELKERFEAKGFNEDFSPFGKDIETLKYASLSKDNKAIYTKHKKYNYNILNGYTLNIDAVYRRNGADADTSVDVGIAEWSDNSGRRIISERFNVDMSERQIETRINKLLNAWNEIVA